MIITKPKDQDPWTVESSFGPPPKTGALYKVLDVTDCHFENIGSGAWLFDFELPFNVGDVVMAIAWEAKLSEGNDDLSTWGQWVIIDVLAHEKVVRFVFHRQDWQRHFERVK